MMRNGILAPRKWASILAGGSTPVFKVLKLILPAPRHSLPDTWGYVRGFRTANRRRG